MAYGAADAINGVEKCREDGGNMMTKHQVTPSSHSSQGFWQRQLTCTESGKKYCEAQIIPSFDGILQSLAPSEVRSPCITWSGTSRVSSNSRFK